MGDRQKSGIGTSCLEQWWSHHPWKLVLIRNVKLRNLILNNKLLIGTAEVFLMTYNMDFIQEFHRYLSLSNTHLMETVTVLANYNILKGR